MKTSQQRRGDHTRMTPCFFIQKNSPQDQLILSGCETRGLFPDKDGFCGIGEIVDNQATSIAL